VPAFPTRGRRAKIARGHAALCASAILMRELIRILCGCVYASVRELVFSAQRGAGASRGDQRRVLHVDDHIPRSSAGANNRITSPRVTPVTGVYRLDERWLALIRPEVESFAVDRSWATARPADILQEGVSGPAITVAGRLLRIHEGQLEAVSRTCGDLQVLLARQSWPKLGEPAQSANP